MSFQQLCLFTSLYLSALVIAALFTRPTVRRIVATVAGAAVVGAVALGADAVGERLGWWRMAIWEPRLLPLVYIGFVVSIAPIYLVTWRVARKFGLLGLSVVVVVLAVIGPPRDYAYMARFPEWGSYGPGIAPVLAIAAIYASLVPLGHVVMRLVAGPADADPLAHRPWESA
jgi:hypothetical protein